MMWISWIIMGLVMNYIFLPVFFKLQFTTAYEYFEVRFNKRVRKLASAMYVMTVIVSLPVYVYGPSLAFNQVSGFNIHLTAFVISCICIFYTSLGGLKAVVWADSFQFCCTFCTLVIILVKGTISVGGIYNVYHRAEVGDRLEVLNMNPDPTIRSSFWSIVIGHIVIWLTLSGVNPAGVQRFLAVPTFKDSQKVLLIFVILSIITKSIGCFSGLVVYARYSDCDPLKAGQIRSADQIMPYFVLDVASQSPGLSGVFVSGLLSTALSTLSTALNTVSGTIYKDFVSPFMPAHTIEGRANNIMKVIAVIVGIIVVILIFVIEHLGTILQMSLSLTGAFTGALLGLFTLGMVFPMVNTKGAFSGTIISLIVMVTIVVKSQMLIWNGSVKSIAKPLETYGCNGSTVLTTDLVNNDDISIHGDAFWLYRISFYYFGPIGTAISVIIAIAVSWITKRKNDAPVALELLSPCIHRFIRVSNDDKWKRLELGVVHKKDMNPFIKKDKNHS